MLPWQKNPAGQSSGAGRPLVAHTVPDGHAWPTDTWALQYIPTGQRTGAALMAVQKLPAGHAMGADELAGQ
jgi:hypothetical protein